MNNKTGKYMPTVSIILPNYNYDYFIPEAIASIKAQTLQDFECIIIDDASTDNSVAIVKKLIKKDPRFKLIVLPETKGISHARNVGLDNATGEYIAFLDSDDCYTQYALEKLVDVARRTNVDVVNGLAQFINADFLWHKQKDDTKVEFSIETDINKNMFSTEEQKWIWIWRRIYKRSFLQGIRFREEMKLNGDDITFVLDFCYKMKSFANTNIITVLHRLHPGSISQLTQSVQREKLSSFPLMFKHISEDLDDKYDMAFLYNLYNSLFINMCEQCLLKKDLPEEDRLFIQRTMQDACRMIQPKYLQFKLKILCRYIACLK